MPLDDLIPFNELYVIPYVIWFPYMFLMGGYLFFMDKDAFIRYIWGFIIGFSTSLICFALFPNGQDLRPDGGNIPGKLNKHRVCCRLLLQFLQVIQSRHT
jgi:hypothetical protein